MHSLRDRVGSSCVQNSGKTLELLEQGDWNLSAQAVDVICQSHQITESKRSFDSGPESDFVGWGCLPLVHNLTAKWRC